MNLPLQKIHDPFRSYGRLLLPLPGGRWLGYFKRFGFALTDKGGFHNCSRTGVY